MTTTETKRLPKGIWLLDLPAWTAQHNGPNGYIAAVAAKFVELLKKADGTCPDYVVTRDLGPDGDWSDLCFSNMNFFNGQINDALEKASLKLKVEGRSGGGSAGIKESIRKEFPDYDSEIYVSHYVLARGCLYRVRPVEVTTGVG